MAGFEEAAKEIAPLLAKRLGIDAAASADMAERFLLAVADQAVVNVRSQTVGPSSVPAVRVQLVEHVASRLGRLPSVRELTALLRVTEPVARTTLRNVLAVSDRANDVALQSVFGRATSTKSVGRGGNPPSGKIWEFASAADLELARDLLESRSVKFTTREEGDGTYALVIDRVFDPAKL